MTRNRSWSLRPDPKRYLSPIADIGAKYTPLKAVSVAICSTGVETEVIPFVADLMSTAGPHQSSARKRSAGRDLSRVSYETNSLALKAISDRFRRFPSIGSPGPLHCLDSSGRPPYFGLSIINCKCMV